MFTTPAWKNPMLNRQIIKSQNDFDIELIMPQRMIPSAEGNRIVFLPKWSEKYGKTKPPIVHPTKSMLLATNATTSLSQIKSNYKKSLNAITVQIKKIHALSLWLALHHCILNINIPISQLLWLKFYDFKHFSYIFFCILAISVFLSFS